MSRLPGSKAKGGLLDIIEMLQGFEVAAGALEPEVLSARIVDYKPTLLDRLCVGGEVVWGRFTHRRDNGNNGHGRGSLTRTTPMTLALRESLEWLIDHQAEVDASLSGAPRELVELLTSRGASFLSEIITVTRRLPSDVEDALWQLAAAGRVTTDSVEPLRLRINGKSNNGRRTGRLRRTNRRSRAGYSRWSLLGQVDSVSETVELRAQQLLRRYGILFPELLGRDPLAPRWRELVQVLRRLEARGEIRGGRFVSGFVGEQFALPEAVEALRAAKRQDSSGQWIVVSACDPLNVVGSLTPGDRVPAVLGNRIVFKDGVPVCSLENGNLVSRWTGEDAVLAKGRSLLSRSPMVSVPEPVLP